MTYLTTDLQPRKIIAFSAGFEHPRVLCDRNYIRWKSSMRKTSRSQNRIGNAFVALMQREF